MIKIKLFLSYKAKKPKVPSSGRMTGNENFNCELYVDVRISFQPGSVFNTRLDLA